MDLTSPEAELPDFSDLSINQSVQVHSNRNMPLYNWEIVTKDFMDSCKGNFNTIRFDLLCLPFCFKKLVHKEKTFIIHAFQHSPKTLIFKPNYFLVLS